MPVSLLELLRGQSPAVGVGGHLLAPGFEVRLNAKVGHAARRIGAHVGEPGRNAHVSEKRIQHGAVPLQEDGFGVRQVPVVRAAAVRVAEDVSRPVLDEVAVFGIRAPDGLVKAHPRGDAPDGKGVDELVLDRAMVVPGVDHLLVDVVVRGRPRQAERMDDDRQRQAPRRATADRQRDRPRVTTRPLPVRHLERQPELPHHAFPEIKRLERLRVLHPLEVQLERARHVLVQPLADVHVVDAVGIDRPQEVPPRVRVDAHERIVVDQQFGTERRHVASGAKPGVPRAAALIPARDDANVDERAGQRGAVRPLQVARLHEEVLRVRERMDHEAFAVPLVARRPDRQPGKRTGVLRHGKRHVLGRRVAVDGKRQHGRVSRRPRQRQQLRQTPAKRLQPMPRAEVAFVAKGGGLGGLRPAPGRKGGLDAVLRGSRLKGRLRGPSFRFRNLAGEQLLLRRHGLESPNRRHLAGEALRRLLGQEGGDVQLAGRLEAVFLLLLAVEPEATPASRGRIGKRHVMPAARCAFDLDGHIPLLPPDDVGLVLHGELERRLR